MSKKLLINIVLLSMFIAAAWYNYHLTQTGRYEEAFRDPLLMIIACFGGMLFSLFWIVVELLKTIFSNNAKAMERLNGDFWTVILGPVKKEE